jgi:hypothetical protein
MARFLVFSMLFAVLLAGPVSSKTWTILSDGTGDAPTIQAGIDSASAGDTVLVACGTYYETDIALKSGIVLTSETGTSDCVTIDGGYTGNVLDCYQVNSTCLVGLRATHGMRGLTCVESEVEVIRCAFDHNGPAGMGGGAFTYHCSPSFHECVFDNNSLDDPAVCLAEGGGVFSRGGAPIFVSCTFSDNRAGIGGGGFGCEDGCQPVLKECFFIGNDANFGAGASICGDSDGEISGCTFVDNRILGAGDLDGIVHCQFSTVSLDRCIIAFNTNGCGFYWNGYGTWPTLTCCDIYANPDGDWVGPTADQYGTNGNIAEDPLFCEPEAGDYHLCSISPCLDADSCGTIGAFGYGGCTPGHFWTDVSSGVLAHAGAGNGVAWMDYDNDGDLDIFFTNRGGHASKLARNDSLTAEGFVNATPPIIETVENSRGAAWGDYDGDGDLDLYRVNNGANHLYRNDGSGDFVDVTGGAPLDDSGIGHTASWADYDNDGDLDLYLVNNGQNKLFANHGAGIFADVTSGPLGDAGSGRGMGWADYDDDGDLDIYVANNDGANVLLRNEGAGVFTDATTSVVEIPGASWGVAWGDYDNDGDLDLYVANEGPNNLLRNDGGTFVDVTASPLDCGLASRSAVWGDYDLDGDLDLYVTNNNAANGLYRNDGGSFSVASPGCGFNVVADAGEGFGCGFGDYDKDGDLDIYVANEGPNKLLRNELDSGGHWLEVGLVGIVSNTFGQGARVHIIIDGASQMREICGASGYASQGPLSAFFGLGPETVVDTLRIEWPSGAAQVLTSVACDQSLEVVEEGLSGLADNDPAKPSVMRLYPVKPNPFMHGTLIGFDLPRTSEVSLCIYDASGRLVRTILGGISQAAGRHTALWDGCNEVGRKVAPGVYFCELSSGSERSVRSLVLLK